MQHHSVPYTQIDALADEIIESLEEYQVQEAGLSLALALIRSMSANPITQHGEVHMVGEILSFTAALITAGGTPSGTVH